MRERESAVLTEVSKEAKGNISSIFSFDYNGRLSKDYKQGYEELFQV